MTTFFETFFETTKTETNRTKAGVLLRHAARPDPPDDVAVLLSAAQTFATLAIAEQLEKIVYRYEQVTDRAYNA